MNKILLSRLMLRPMMIWVMSSTNCFLSANLSSMTTRNLQNNWKKILPSLCRKRISAWNSSSLESKKIWIFGSFVVKVGRGRMPSSRFWSLKTFRNKGLLSTASCNLIIIMIYHHQVLHLRTRKRGNNSKSWSKLALGIQHLPTKRPKRRNPTAL